MGEKNVGAFIGLSGWLPFEQHLSDILRCDQKSAVVEESQDENDSNDETESESTSSDDEQEDDQDGEEEDRDEFSESESEDDPFERPGKSPDEFDPLAEDGNEDVPLPNQAIDYIRDILDLPVSGSEQPGEDSSVSILYQLRIPVFIGHGTEDPKVSVKLGEKMTRILSTGLGMNITWKAYQGLGHWYRAEDEVEDILRFLESHVKLPVEKSS